MDAERFLRELPALFDDFPRSEHPRDPRFAGILERVDGLVCEAPSSRTSRRARS